MEFKLGEVWVLKIFSSFIISAFIILAFSSLNTNAQDLSGKGSAKTIEQQVFKKILRLPYYEVFDNIKYSVNGGTVTLYGEVRNATNRKSAERVVEDISGVINVVNNIEVLPLGSFDESIRGNLYRTLANRGGLYRYFNQTNPSVRLVVDRGHVRLEGFVANRGDYNLMNILARGVSGTFSVTNNLVIENQLR